MKPFNMDKPPFSKLKECKKQEFNKYTLYNQDKGEIDNVYFLNNEDHWL